MPITERYVYSKLTREESGTDGRKYIDPQGARLASVTTILDKTKSEETKRALAAWRRSIGDKKAAEITKEAAFRGTMMHSFLETYVKEGSVSVGTNFFHQQSYKMANVIIEQYLNPFLDEAWGLEASLYFPGIYAGTTDMVGVYQGQPSIIDFKQSNKVKGDDRVIDYKLQLCAYICAHNIVHGTDIKQGVILMCTKDLEPLHWVLSGQELEDFTQQWWDRVAQYYGV
jgi:genome maintenance exonuclease 1